MLESSQSSVGKSLQYQCHSNMSDHTHSCNYLVISSIALVPVLLVKHNWKQSVMAWATSRVHIHYYTLFPFHLHVHIDVRSAAATLTTKNLSSVVLHNDTHYTHYTQHIDTTKVNHTLPVGCRNWFRLPSSCYWVQFSNSKSSLCFLICTCP